MSDDIKYQDLCTTCNYGPTCVRRKYHGKPVWYCEEFDDYQPRSLKTTGFGAKVERIEKLLAKDLLRGLCANCENNEICMIPKSEGGIWHCEEYR